VRVGMDGFSAEAADRVKATGMSISQDITTLGAAFWGRGKFFSAGLALSGVVSDIGTGEGSGEDLLPSQPVSSLSVDSSVSYALLARGALRDFSAAIGRSRYLTSACLPRIEVLSSGHFRTVPLALSVGEDNVVLSYERRPYHVQVTGGLKRIVSNGSVEADNMLSTVSEWLLRRASLDAGAEIGKFGFDLDFTAQFGGGYIEGYGKGIRYLVIDSAEVLRLNGSARIRLPLRFRLGMFGDDFRATSPIGSLNAAPFTAWSVFRPTMYRLQDMDLRLQEFGGEIGRDFPVGRRGRLDCGLSVSRIAVSMAYSTLERQIVVLIPVYVDSTRVKAVDWEGIDLGIRLNYEIPLGRAIIGCWLRQHVPIQTNGSAGGSTAAGRDNGIDSRSGGGTSAGLFVRITAGTARQDRIHLR